MAHHYSERERLNHHGMVPNHGMVRGSIHGNLKRRKTLILKPQRTRKLEDGDLPRWKSRLQLCYCPWTKYTIEVWGLKKWCGYWDLVTVHSHTFWCILGMASSNLMADLMQLPGVKYHLTVWGNTFFLKQLIHSFSNNSLKEIKTHTYTYIHTRGVNLYYSNGSACLWLSCHRFSLIRYPDALKMYSILNFQFFFSCIQFCQ